MTFGSINFADQRTPLNCVDFANTFTLQILLLTKPAHQLLGGVRFANMYLVNRNMSGSVMRLCYIQESFLIDASLPWCM